MCFLNCSHILTSVVERSNCLCLQTTAGDWCFVGLSESLLVGAVTSFGFLTAFFFGIWVFLAPVQEHLVFKIGTSYYIHAHIFTFVHSFQDSFSSLSFVTVNAFSTGACFSFSLTCVINYIN